MVNKLAGFKVFILPVAAVFVVMMSVLYIKPAYDEMQSLKKSQAEKQLQFDNLQKQNQQLAQLKNKWASMENERSLTQTALPAKGDVENYIAELYGRASRSGVLLASITSDEKSAALEPVACGSSANPAVSVTTGPVGTAAADSVSQPSNLPATGNVTSGSPASATQSCANAISVKLTASGNWDQIVNFFKYLEDTNRIANITSVAITSSQQNKPDQQSSNDLISASVDLSVFYKEKNEVGSSSIVNSLAGGNGFEESVIKKLNEVVFAPYVAPVVSQSGERNIFK